MKLVNNKQILLIIFIIASIYNVISFRKFTYSKNKGPVLSEIDTFLTRGFSYLNQEKEINQFPESTLSKKKIFSHEAQLLNNILPNLLLSNERFRFVINRNISLMNMEEVRKNDQSTVEGEYYPTVNSGSYKNALSHIYRRGLFSQLTTDSYGMSYISQDHETNFPMLSDTFLKDSYNKFYKFPHSVEVNATFSDFVNDDNLIQGAIDFFKDYGTHYISEYTYGFKIGFNREYRTDKTFLENKDGKIPNTNLELMLSFIQESEKSNSTAHVNNLKDQTKTFLKSEEPVKKNTAPVPIVTMKAAPQIPNSPPSDFDPNNPDGSMDDDSIFEDSSKKGDFNTILKDSISSLGNKKDVKIGTKYDFLVDEVPKKPNNMDPLFSQFAVGECETRDFFIKSNRCNMKNPRLIKYQITPIHNLFNPFLQTKASFSIGGKKIGKDDMKFIYTTIRKMFYFIQEALNPDLFVVTEIFSENYERANVNKMHPCFRQKSSTLEIIRQKYMVTNLKLRFSKESIMMNKYLPVIGIKNYATPKKSFEIISNQGNSMYWCLKQEHNIHPQDLVNGEWRKRKFLIDIRYIIDNDDIPFTQAGYECKQTWQFTDPVTQNLNRWHFCVKYTSDFTHPLIVTDVKIFEFQKTMGKCFHNSLVVWNNGREYYCNCEINFGDLTDDKSQKDKDIFFCVSRKNNLFYKPLVANQPINSKSRFAPPKIIAKK